MQPLAAMALSQGRDEVAEAMGKPVSGIDPG
jgi:hypothetical protein